MQNVRMPDVAERFVLRLRELWQYQRLFLVPDEQSLIHSWE
jgi:hypothetical protein